MPEEAKERILKRLNAQDVPIQLVERLRGQMTGKVPTKSAQGTN